MSSIHVRQVSVTDPHLLSLIRKLDEYLAEKYPEDEIYGLDLSSPSMSSVLFAVAYADHTPVGCGALAPLEGESLELKRFYVEEAYRQQGVATQVLTFLEHEAAKQGFRFVRLETGTLQPEAIKFYKKHSYREIDRFGRYVDSGLSVCFEKVISYT